MNGVLLSSNQVLGWAFLALSAFIAVLFGMLRYFFSRRDTNIDLRFDRLDARMDEIEEALRSEVRILEGRMHEVEVHMAGLPARYVSQSAFDSSLNRIHQRIDDLVSLLKKGGS